MTCDRCEFEFCFKCGRTWPNEEDDEEGCGIGCVDDVMKVIVVVMGRIRMIRRMVKMVMIRVCRGIEMEVQRTRGI